MDKPIQLSRDIGGTDKKEIGGLLYVGYEDYYSSRMLFLNGMLLQGCFLANTAIEKLLKAMLFYAEDFDYKANKHKSYLCLDEITRRGFTSDINRGFLLALSHIYDCRYIGDNTKIRPGFNFTILKNKFLAELDYTVDVLGNTIRAGSKEIGATKTANELCNINKTSDLVRRGNYLYSGNSKNEYCKAIDDVLELRVMVNYETLIFKYKTENSKNDGIFKYLLSC